MINHFLNVFTFTYLSNPYTFTISSVIYHLPLLSFEIWTSIHLHYLTVLPKHTPISLSFVPAVSSTYNPFLLDSCSSGPPSEHQFKFHITFISALEFSGFALLLIQNHYHSSFISILVSAIVDYSYTLEYKLSGRQRCIPPLSHNLTSIGQDGHVCNPSMLDAKTASLEFSTDYTAGT